MGLNFAYVRLVNAMGKQYLLIDVRITPHGVHSMCCFGLSFARPTIAERNTVDSMLAGNGERQKRAETARKIN